MDLEKIAQQAMDYLDSVGVAADYEIDTTGKYGVTIITDRWSFQFVKHITADEMIGFIERKIKSPN
ncbi:hypothetical protein TW1_059 [Pseudoalteromonas phage TW1]|uniref:hypothetical protein n=1 Tax=Pseudoalteromonas phage TW1 TaxID=1366055 RepID=UPI00035AB049|nr:hypothetical protein PP585_gp59 [Pseudoalteromonas phage TW1]AGR46575.1 hypothetical protein TW1_059 [Pseudoalteromonas phage TW1]